MLTALPSHCTALPAFRLGPCCPQAATGYPLYLCTLALAFAALPPAGRHGLDHGRRRGAVAHQSGVVGKGGGGRAKQKVGTPVRSHLIPYPGHRSLARAAVLVDMAGVPIRRVKGFA